MDIFRGGMFLLLVVTMFGCSSSGISDLSKRSLSSASVQPVYEASKAFADIPIATNDSVDIKKSLLLNTGEQWIGRAVIKSSQNIEDAFTYYQANMPDKGWRAVTSVQSEVSILTFEKCLDSQLYKFSLALSLLPFLREKLRQIRLAPV
jgi:hypothetical protein